MLHYGLLDSWSLDGGHYERLSVVIQGLDHVNRKKPAIQQNPAGPYLQFRAFFEQFTHDIAVIIRFLDEPGPKRGPGSAGHAVHRGQAVKPARPVFRLGAGYVLRVRILAVPAHQVLVYRHNNRIPEHACLLHVQCLPLDRVIAPLTDLPGIDRADLAQHPS